MTHGSLFSGIGGFDLAAQWMGWENKFHCEWNKFGQKVLKYYWPNAESFEDITKTDFSKYANSIDILTGGFPCQPYSVAGKRKGKNDERHLWPEMLRAIQEIKPTWIVGENVRGLINWSGGLVFEEVQADLESEAYEVQPFILPAASVNAPHQRDRIWFVAYSNLYGDLRRSKRIQDTNGQENIRRKEQNEECEQIQLSNQSDCIWNNSNTSSIGRLQNNWEGKSGINNKSDKVNSWQNFPTQSPICNGNDGISSKLDGITFPRWRSESIKAGGNAIVPQVAFKIFQAIQEYEHLNSQGANN